MFKFLFKPTIKSKLVKGGEYAEVTLKNATPRETYLLLYLTMCDLASRLNMEPRALMNKVIDLDKQLTKLQKIQKKEAYRQKHIKRHEL